MSLAEKKKQRTDSIVSETRTIFVGSSMQREEDKRHEKSNMTDKYVCGKSRVKIVVACCEIFNTRNGRDANDDCAHLPSLHTARVVTAIQTLPNNRFARL